MIHFAWVGPEDTEWQEAFARSDEDVFAFEVTHEEGEFPSLQVDIRNPRIGLLNEGRDLWAWLAYDDGSTDGVTPLFYGRIVGVPEQLHEEAVRLAFIARPPDYDEVKAALAETLKVAPYWDPIWHSPDRRNDPDAALEARPALWHIDRLTHAVTASDINVGEDGTLDLAGEFFRDSLGITYSQVPASRVLCEAEVFWTQEGAGRVDLTQRLLQAFQAAGTFIPNAITTYTGEGLERDWPQEGRSIGGGWTVGHSSIRRVDGTFTAQVFEKIFTALTSAQFPRWTFHAEYTVDYQASRSYSEKVAFTLVADTQPIVTDPGDEDTILINLTSSDISEPVDPDNATPIEDVRRRSYFQTERGHQSLEYVIAQARARLLHRARAVEVRFDTEWEHGLGLSCRKNVRIADPRLPGGEATGKVIRYVLTMDADAGIMETGVTIGCTIGRGEEVVPVTGTPVYVDEGYVDPGWQAYEGQTNLVAGDVTWASFEGAPIDDDGLDLFDMMPGRVVTKFDVINGEDVQREALILTVWQSTAEAAEALNAVHTEVDTELVPVNAGPFETTYEITVSDLMVPKTIDLEAGSSS